MADIVWQGHCTLLATAAQLRHRGLCRRPVSVLVLLVRLGERIGQGEHGNFQASVKVRCAVTASVFFGVAQLMRYKDRNRILFVSDELRAW